MAIANQRQRRRRIVLFQNLQPDAAPIQMRIIEGGDLQVLALRVTNT